MKLYFLKIRAKMLIKQLRREHLDCGCLLGDYIVPISNTKVKLIKVWNNIKKLDPNAPDLNL